MGVGVGDKGGTNFRLASRSDWRPRVRADDGDLDYATNATVANQQKTRQVKKSLKAGKVASPPRIGKRHAVAPIAKGLVIPSRTTQRHTAIHVAEVQITQPNCKKVMRALLRGSGLA